MTRQLPADSYIPVRWTHWQLKQFDAAPLLGYLHRPVNVRLTDDKDRPLKTAHQAAALKAGWKKPSQPCPECRTSSAFL
jgi:hypothetical protein